MVPRKAAGGKGGTQSHPTKTRPLERHTAILAVRLKSLTVEELLEEAARIERRYMGVKR